MKTIASDAGGTMTDMIVVDTDGDFSLEAAPVGYPIIFDALPDIDSFYKEWRSRS